MGHAGHIDEGDDPNGDDGRKNTKPVMNELERKMGNDERADEAKPRQPGRTQSDRLRTLHCIVPADIHRHARKMALESNLSFREYVAAVLQDAGPVRAVAAAQTPCAISPVSTTAG